MSGGVPRREQVPNGGSEKDDDDDDDDHFVVDSSVMIPLLQRTSSIPEQQPMRVDETVDAAAALLANKVRTPVSSRPGSRSSSRASSPVVDDDVPTNVSSEEQLENLPDECLSGDPILPLQHFDESGVVSKYSLQPMLYSVGFILLVEGLERFSFYGVNYTQTSYLTGVYDAHWNAGMDAVPASSYVSISVAVAYTTPFLGAFFADKVLGDYWSIFVGSVFFYLPGLLLIAGTTIPGLFGETFNQNALAVGLLFLWPTGTGIVKSVVNVFGAKQFHPLLQSSLIESYYVRFYMCINIGALIGGVVVPLMAQKNVTIAYFLPVAMLSLGVALFVVGTPRYVRSKPPIHWKDLIRKKKKVPAYEPINNTGDPLPLSVIARVSLLIVPFCIAYSQMATTFIVQGTVMKKAFGFIDAACMNNADAVAVLLFGQMVGSWLYPWLVEKGIKIPTTYKFAIGSMLGAAAIAWALLVEYMIKRTYEETGEQVNIMWQAMAYVLIGAGEIFAVSAAYEVAFTASPPEKKVLSSAVNLFCIGGLPNVICIALYQSCHPWFRNGRGTSSISHIRDYSTAHVYKYFWLLFFISVAGALLNLLPSVREFVEDIEEKATDMIRTPKTPMRPPRREPLPDEESALLKIRRHQYYLKYGSGPSLYKHGSMRAGPSMSRSERNLKKKDEKHMKRRTLSKLYRSDPIMPGVGTIMSAGDGKPVTVAEALRKKPTMTREEPSLTRSTST